MGMMNAKSRDLTPKLSEQVGPGGHGGNGLLRTLEQKVTSDHLGTPRIVQCNGKACIPLLKWPGGKRDLLAKILPLVPKEYGTYYEPFLGGGALYFALQPKQAILSDANLDLIECYKVIRDDPDAVIRKLGQFKNDKSAYLQVRASAPTSSVGRAARFVYLTTLAFNGIYRVNLRGEFNVPYGWKKHLDVVQENRILAVSRALAGRALKCTDFEDAVKDAQEGDFIYLDPPYTVAHENNGFLRYNAKVFSWADQARLAETARALAARGCMVVITNACHSSIRTLYTGLRQIIVSRPSRIAASAEHRRAVNELLITNLC